MLNLNIYEFTSSFPRRASTSRSKDESGGKNYSSNKLDAAGDFALTGWLLVSFTKSDILAI